MTEPLVRLDPDGKRHPGKVTARMVGYSLVAIVVIAMFALGVAELLNL